MSQASSCIQNSVAVFPTMLTSALITSRWLSAIEGITASAAVANLRERRVSTIS